MLEKAVEGPYVLNYYTDESKRKLKGTIYLDECEQVEKTSLEVTGFPLNWNCEMGFFKNCAVLPTGSIPQNSNCICVP